MLDYTRLQQNFVEGGSGGRCSPCPFTQLLVLPLNLAYPPLGTFTLAVTTSRSSFSLNPCHKAALHQVWRVVSISHVTGVNSCHIFTHSLTGWRTINGQFPNPTLARIGRRKICRIILGLKNEAGGILQLQAWRVAIGNIVDHPSTSSLLPSSC